MKSPKPKHSKPFRNWRGDVLQPGAIIRGGHIESYWKRKVQTGNLAVLYIQPPGKFPRSILEWKPFVRSPMTI